MEIAALDGLAKSRCKSTPHLIDQNESGGKDWHIWFILMTKCSGKPLGAGKGVEAKVDPFWDKTTREERDKIREAFKEAYLYDTSSPSHPMYITLRHAV